MCSRLKYSIWLRAAEYNDKSGEMENWVFVNQVIQINLLLLCEQHGVYINKKKKIVSVPIQYVGRQESLLHSPLLPHPEMGKKLSTQFPLANPTMPYFPHRYLQAHCFGFGHITVTAMRAGKTSSMTAAVFLSWQDSAQERIYSREEKACVRSEEEMHRE